MNDLASQINAAIDTREAAARAATTGPWLSWADTQDPLSFPRHGVTTGEGVWLAGCDDVDAAHIALHGPDAVLRACQAHRELVAECVEEIDGDVLGVTSGYQLAERVLKRMAATYGLTTEEGT